jgi:hypothetical protein
MRGILIRKRTSTYSSEISKPPRKERSDEIHLSYHVRHAVVKQLPLAGREYVTAKSSDRMTEDFYYFMELLKLVRQNKKDFHHPFNISESCSPSSATAWQVD